MRGEALRGWGAGGADRSGREQVRSRLDGTGSPTAAGHRRRHLPCPSTCVVLLIPARPGPAWGAQCWAWARLVCGWTLVAQEAPLPPPWPALGQRLSRTGTRLSFLSRRWV